MIYLIFIMFLLFFCGRIIREVIRYIQIQICLSKVSRFISAYSQNRYNGQLQSLLSYSSIVASYVPAPRLSHTAKPNANHYRAEQILPKLLDLRAAQKHTIVSSLNPLHAIRDIIVFPITILRWLGLKPNKAVSVVLSSIWWIFQYVLDTFQPEIKDLLIEFFKNLVSA